MAGGGVPRRRPRTGAAGFAASRQATDWAESGYELAFGQTVVPADATATPDTKPADGTITVGRWNAGVRGAGREVLLSRTQGGMVSYTFAGNEFVLRRPAITTFRPLTDNDRGRRSRFRARPVAGRRPLRPLRGQRARADRRQHAQGHVHV